MNTIRYTCTEDTNRRELIKLIKHVMIEKDLKKVDVARVTGWTEQTTSNLLNPSYRPDSSMTVETLTTLCNAVGCDLVIEIVER